MAGDPHSGQTRSTDRRIALAREWDDLVERVRRLGPEFADFLAPPRLADLTPGVGEGTGVLINVTAQRCDALLVTGGGATSVPLPALALDELQERTAAHLDRLRQVDEAAQLLHHTQERARVRPVAATFQAHHRAKLALAGAQAELDERLRHDLAWLWKTVAGPVLGALRADDPAAREDHRIWWCPSGLLSFLPLHAAGHHDGSGRSVLDRTVSSYTPTLRALAHAARPRTAAPREPASEREKLLVVAVGEVPGQPPLPQTTAEVELLREVFGDQRLTVLAGREATREAVLEQLADHRWVHFSCHGQQDVFDPSRGGLLLSDGILTVGELGRGRYDGDFGFLSACMTASGGLGLSDEVITLGAGLHYAGFRHVLATLWSVDADTATELAEQVFRSLMCEGRFGPELSAKAAADAVLRLRDRDPDRPSRWAAFTHTGP
ncbi:CHAT domain-containing protein [Streptomyces sparsogenes]|uniref:CHAT domain-containing protein n=1 Tax=Streptomyces sparsogenes TaxID=67365 RepID=UPI003405A312